MRESLAFVIFVSFQRDLGGRENQKIKTKYRVNFSTQNYLIHKAARQMIYVRIIHLPASIFQLLEIQAVFYSEASEFSFF